MVTRLKLIEPFQVVRMGAWNSRRIAASLPPITLSRDGRSEDDRRPVAECGVQELHATALPRRGSGHLDGGLLAGGGAPRRRDRERPARPRRPQGRRVL